MTLFIAVYLFIEYEASKYSKKPSEDKLSVCVINAGGRIESVFGPRERAVCISSLLRIRARKANQIVQEIMDEKKNKNTKTN